MVKRYTLAFFENDGDPWMQSDEDGKYVLHTDYAALLEAAKLLAKWAAACSFDGHGNPGYAETDAMENPIARALIEGREP